LEFVNYHCHRQYSNAVTIDCAISHEDYIRRIKELGHETLTVIEHGYTGGMTSILEAYSLCKKNNIKMNVILLKIEKFQMIAIGTLLL